MALTATLISSYNSTTGVTSFVSSSCTPTANTLLLAVIRYTAKSAAPTTVQTTNSTNRYTFAEVGNDADASNYFGIWAAKSGATPPTDTITYTLTATNASGAHVHVVEIGGAELGGTAAQAVIWATPTTGTGTTSTLTFAAASAAGNRPLAAVGQIGNRTIAPRANWTELGEANYASPNDTLETQWRDDAFETTCTATWSTDSDVWSMIGVEIRLALASDSVGMIPIF